MNANTISFTNEGFTKSSYCAKPAGCVEVAIKDGTVAVRDAKDTDQKPLIFTKDEWNAFVQGVKAGEFDIP